MAHHSQKGLHIPGAGVMDSRLGVPIFLPCGHWAVNSWLLMVAQLGHWLPWCGAFLGYSSWKYSFPF